MSKNEMTAGSPATGSTANSFAELEAREATIAKNLEGLDASTKQQAIGEELILIHERKLYQAAGFKSFKAYLTSRRNRISRPRAYQLIKFVKGRRACYLAGSPMPANERQSRASSAGTQGVDSFERRWTRIFKYLMVRFRSCPMLELERFVQTLEVTTKFFRARTQQLKQGAVRGKNTRNKGHQSQSDTSPAEEFFSKRTQMAETTQQYPDTVIRCQSQVQRSRVSK